MAVIIILYIISLYLSFVFYNRVKNNYQNNLVQLKNLSEELEKIQNSEETFIYCSNTIYYSTAEIAESKNKCTNRIDDLIIKFNTISEVKYIKNKNELDSLSKSIKKKFEDHKYKILNYSYAAQNKNDKEEGYVVKILELGDGIEDQLESHEDPYYYLSFAKSKNLVLNYLLSNNLNNLEKASSDIEDLKMQMWEFESNVIDDLNSYSGIIMNLKKIDKEIGFVTKSGLYKEIIDSFDSLQKELNNYSIPYQNSTRFNIIISSIVYIIFICVLTFFVLLILLKFIKTIILPVRKLEYATTALTAGRFTDFKIEKSSIYEINSITDNIKKISNNIIKKTQFATDLLNQDFTSDFEILGNDDLLGKSMLDLKDSLEKAKKEQEKHDEENKIRRYINEGLAKFGDILRSNSDNLSKLADEIIRNLTKYINAIQSGIFLIEAEHPDSLSLIASFAYNRKKYLEKTIKIGEGLVGSCAKERKTIYIKEIPEDYLLITSGLGDAPPRNLLLVPMICEEEVIGILEIASLNEFHSFEIDFAEQVATSIASTIISVRNNAKTAELLKKSQEQATQMSEQEEEMRQNMEELKATQEESARREEDLKGILDALDNSFFILEYDLDGTIIRVNEKLLWLIKKDQYDIIGKPYDTIYENSKNIKFTNEIFNKVKDGNGRIIIEKLIINKKEITLKQHLNPVYTKDGTIFKIINFAEDITGIIKER